VRTLVAALLVLGALAAVLCGWGISGWKAVQTEQQMVLAQAHDRALERTRVAAEAALRHVEQLRSSESARPYFHYQNLFHDPRGSDVDAVMPSPLVDGPADPVVKAHFQLRRSGDAIDVSVPSINDVLPELSSPDRAPTDGTFRTALRPLASALLAAAPSAVPSTSVVASATPTPARRRPRQVASAPRPTVVASATRPEATAPRSPDAGTSGNQPAEVIQQEVQTPLQFELSPEQYLQNAVPEQVYRQTRQVDDNPALAAQAKYGETIKAPVLAAANTATAETPDTTFQAAATSTSPRPAAAASTETTITITVPPLEWVALDDEPAPGSLTGVAPARLFALRRIATPEGELVQGFEVDRDALLEHAQNYVGAGPDGERYPLELLDATTALTASETIPLPKLPWVMPVDAERELAAARPRLSALRGAFLERFAPIAALATLCGVLVIVIVARAERLAHERARFAAAAAHELRTPLAGIQLYGDMLAGGLGDPAKTERYAGRIAEDASRLGRVVANVLGFSQLERGNLTIHAAAGDARDAAERAVERVRAAMTRDGVRVTLADGPPLMARFDDDAVARILGNLLDNAEKYSRGAATRAIDVEVRPAGDRVEIAVRDHGDGVPAKVARRLFRPFRRGVSADGPNGLGLGLSMSRTLARAFGGELQLAPSAGERGACFVLSLPRA
jgi:signal transduction histidine kinase